MISVITPTYNRGYIINKAYKSLLTQTSKDFEWIIIDDGSTDNTKEIVNEFILENKININYFYKENGGKHTALNYGFKKANGDYILILDSDDYLTENAIELSLKYIEKYKNENISGISFLRKIENPIHKEKIFEEDIKKPIEFKYNNNFLSDMCEVYKKDILLEYPFPEFKNEKFLSEAIVWNKIALKYDMVFVPKEIYCTKYLSDGLSRNWLKNVLKCPLGARANSLLFMNKKFKFSIRVKNCIMYNIYSMISNKRILKDSKMKIWSVVFYIPCIVITICLKIKYREVFSNGKEKK